MDKRDFMKSLAVGAVSAPLLAGLAACKSGKTAQSGETSFERIMRTRKIRCAYAAYEPAIIVNPITRQINGVFYDLANMVGEYLGLSVEWVEEVGYGVIIEGFKTGRYDLFGGAVWPTSERGVVANFTNPTYFSAVHLWVRAKDSKFENYRDLDKPSVTLSTKDGDIADSIAKSSFPNAKRLSTMQMDDKSAEFINVITGKADAAFAEPFAAQLFMKKHPGSLRALEPSNPIRVFGHTMMFNDDDWRLKKMFDTALAEIQNAGVVTRLVEQYTGRADTFLPVAKAYGTL